MGGHAVLATQLLELLQREAGVSVEFLPFNSPLWGPFRVLQRAKYVRTIVTYAVFVSKLVARVHRFDVVHAFAAANVSFLLSAAPAILVGRLLKRGTIVHYHDGRARQHLSEWRSARLLRLADVIVVPSGYLLDVFQHFGYVAEAISNVVDLHKFKYRERRPVRPRFLHNRGHEELYNVPCTLRAFAIVQRRYPEASLTIAHDGPLRGELERLAREWRLQNVHFVGRVSPDDMPRLYDAADIYLTSPNVDNMPLSVLESYAAGVPVVATRAGGIPYIARHEETALLVDLDDHDAMAQAALRLIEDHKLAQRLTANARNVSKSYSWAQVGGKWLSLYARLALGSSPRRTQRVIVPASEPSDR
jgi:glycosyltransferase involved in cell wall biosynthesis